VRTMPTTVSTTVPTAAPRETTYSVIAASSE
jgi:hypothetical protein